jgi:hypothetical protein
MSHCRQRNRVRRFSRWANHLTSGKNLKKMGTLPLTFERKSHNIKEVCNRTQGRMWWRKDLSLEEAFLAK